MLHITSNEERMILFRNNNKSITNQTSKLSNIMQDYQWMFHITSNEERVILFRTNKSIMNQTMAITDVSLACPVS